MLNTISYVGAKNMVNSIDLKNTIRVRLDKQTHTWVYTFVLPKINIPAFSCDVVPSNVYGAFNPHSNR